MLGDILVEHLVIELSRIFLSQFIVDFSSMGFNNITLARGWTVSQRVITPLDIVFHDFLVLKSSVLLLDESLGWRFMLLIIRSSFQGIVL
jgi:hypothetical protein